MFSEIIQITKEKELFIFDFDGTIANTAEAHTKAFKTIFKNILPNFNYNEIAGLSTFEAITLINSKYELGLQPEEIIRMTAEKKSIAREQLSLSLSFLPGMKKLINFLGKQADLAIASSASKLSLEIAIDRLQLEDKFRLIISSDDVSKSKPEPDIFNLVANTLQIQKNSILIFEDSEAGFQAALSAGIQYYDITKYHNWASNL